MEHAREPSRPGIPLQLDERGILLQVTVFSVVGIAVTCALAVHSGTDALPYRLLEIATTRVSWAFIPAVAYIVDRSRDMFRTNTEIREAARQKVREEGIKEGEQKAEDRIRSSLEAEGVAIPPEIAERVFNHKNGEES